MASCPCKPVYAARRDGHLYLAWPDRQKARASFLLYRTSDSRISTEITPAETLGVKKSDLVK